MKAAFKAIFAALAVAISTSASAAWIYNPIKTCEPPKSQKVLEGVGGGNCPTPHSCTTARSQSECPLGQCETTKKKKGQKPQIICPDAGLAIPK